MPARSQRLQIAIRIPSPSLSSAIRICVSNRQARSSPTADRSSRLRSRLVFVARPMAHLEPWVLAGEGVLNLTHHPTPGVFRVVQGLWPWKIWGTHHQWIANRGDLQPPREGRSGVGGGNGLPSIVYPDTVGRSLFSALGVGVSDLRSVSPARALMGVAARSLSSDQGSSMGLQDPRCHGRHAVVVLLV